MQKLYKKSSKIKKLVLLFSILLSVSLSAGVSPGSWIVNAPLVEPCQTITASIETTVPAADGTGTVVVGKGETVDFFGSAIFSTSGLGATYSWSFGDGDVSNGLEVSHLFNAIGTFNITLTVTDTNPEGCADTQTITVQVLSPYIQIDQVTYTPTQLIEDVLINSPCVNVSNLVSSTGTDFGSSNGIGYFSGDGVSFPFTEGIILTTGNAGRAGGPKTVELSDGAVWWLGDADLENALESLNPGVTNNATFIEFDFVPLADAISFNFVFASEEYGEFQCDYTDAFAFLLTDSDGLTTNLAIVPGTDDPISVLSVRDSAYNDPAMNCASVNPEFFAAYYGPGGLPPLDSPTNFLGHTVNLIAQAAVVPNTSYSIKLVIADDQDTIFDAAVFLEAGSFDLGGDLGDDITIELGTAQCSGTTVTLDTKVPSASHVWYVNGAEILGEILSTLTITEPGTYSANTTFNETCASSDSILVEFVPVPVVVAVENLEICDGGATSFDLTQNNTSILGTQSGSEYVISFHSSQEDADADADPISNEDTVAFSGVDGQQIYVRIEYLTTGCYGTDSFLLNLFNQPTIFPVDDLVVCDDDFDGFATFDLTAVGLFVIGSQLGMEVTFHTSPTDADANLDAVTSPFETTTEDFQTLHIRLEEVATGCYSTTTLDLFVDPLPVVPVISDYELCDDPNSGDQQAFFDLNSKDFEIINDQNSSVSYYATLLDATNEVGALTSPYENTSNSETIYVSLTDLTTGCRSTGSFNLIVNPLPQLVIPTELEVCDDGASDGFTSIDLTLKDNEISGGNINYSISYYLTQLEADSGTDPLVIPYTNTSNPQTIFARGQDINTGCYNTVPLEISVAPVVVASTPQPLEYCDVDSDGFGVFTLTDVDAEIMGGDPELMVSYYDTLLDAENGVGALASPYTNSVINTQTLFGRVISTTVVTNCPTIVDVVLIVHPTPQLLAPMPLEVCDDTTDELATFNLTTKVPEFLNGISPADVSINYYETNADAESESNAIGFPFGYVNLTNPQTIWIRVSYNDTGCKKLTSFDLIVNPLPVLVQPDPMILCDSNSPGDQQESFLLEDSAAQVLDGQTGLSVSYHLSELDADGNLNPLVSPYTNISNPQTIYVRVENDSTGCYDFKTLTLEVFQNPMSIAPIDLFHCDDTLSGDGQEVFDLTTNELFVLNGELGVTPTYFETFLDAQLEINLIPDPINYTNTTISVQTVFVRVTNDITGCFTIVDFDLIVRPLPLATPVEDWKACELRTDNVYAFDLDSQSGLILGSQSASAFEVTYYETLLEATGGTNSLVSPYENMTNPQTIFVSVTNTNTGCRNTLVSFELQVFEAAQATAPLNPYMLCDDTVETDGNPINDTMQFDLSTQNIGVLNGQDPSNYIVRYFVSQFDADEGINELPSLFENTINPQVIIARVDNDTQVLGSGGALSDSSICYETAPLTLQVNPLPIVDLEDDYVLCIGSDGTGILNIPTGLSEVNYAFIWKNASGTVIGTRSSGFVSQGGTYSLEVFDVSFPTNCAAPIATFTVQKSASPIVTAQVSSRAFATTHTIEAEATGLGVYEFSLDLGPWQTSGNFGNVLPGEHVVTARDVNGCGESQAVVYVIDYPKYFTPNGDGFHDTWNIIGISDQYDLKVYIFDRYGKLLKQISPTGQGWDGTYNGIPLPTNDYWFMIDYNEPTTGNANQLKLHFTLKR
ncbi:MAG: Uncharacterised protein [Formosa sp. Hel1_33_131]|nr:MAG: Uncharacterised protein [Formosa sp. Hel1_33_131]